ncbi:hypothetical protein BY458DRAFT_532671 [Sporodiniella umbellata]|nr:hypothetical protein BY458DRAFT_532671 [Sporodiniella umbellata]
MDKSGLEYLREQLKSEQKRGQKEAERIEEAIMEREERVEETEKRIESLGHAIQVLEMKYREEESQVEKLQRSKESVKKELEELNQKLFEEAGRMVRVERREQDRIRQGNDALKNTQKEVENEWKHTLDALVQLKGEMQSRTAIEADVYCRAQLEMLDSHGLDSGCGLRWEQDRDTLLGLESFMRLVGQTPLRKLHSLKQMKYYVREDIEPCLRFGPHPRLTVRKIMDAILVKTCFVEECPPGFMAEQQRKEDVTASLWERFTASSVFSGCQACGRRVKEEEARTVLCYRFRISYFDEWACIDRYCRDRLVTVIEFYGLIRHLRAGLYKNKSLDDLNQQINRLRLQMFLARMGALPYLLSSCHIDAQKVGTAFYGHAPMFPYQVSSDRLSSSTDASLTSLSTTDSFGSH